ncbi:hypothetical protein NKT34_05740 [Paenibacillus polysaccharolyticus]|uniref:hypothetical protein n=1 Tax=Paenibacillus polysaccharolyticus TaxID=582692 RepID=UPI0020A1F456|nr:hypothetical protein [Paenibacillus polysaccharolyticus]MCP1132781.1 hypothetical protein [Paenibacillus polysaccharolyticus]
MNYEAIYYINIDTMSSVEIAKLLSLFPEENDIILFATIEDNLKYESEETRDYLQSLLYYSGDDWIFPHLKPAFLEKKQILWHKTITIEAVEKAISLDNFFRSIALEAGDSIENSKYVFYVIETDDSQLLCISVKSKEDFHARVYPKITNINKKLKILNQI